MNGTEGNGSAVLELPEHKATETGTGEGEQWKEAADVSGSVVDASAKVSAALETLHPKKSRKSKPRKSGETAPPSNKAALSTPSELSIDEMVVTVARRKTDIGQSFQGKKGKQTLFALTCKAYKSALGMSVTDRVNDVAEKSIRDAVDRFWRGHAERILTYGRMVSAVYDKPKALFDKEGKQLGLVLNATLKAERDAKDNAEEKLNQSYLITAARKRLLAMESNTEGKYDGADIRKQVLKINEMVTRGLEIGAVVLEERDVTAKYDNQKT